MRQILFHGRAQWHATSVIRELQELPLRFEVVHERGRLPNHTRLYPASRRLRKARMNTVSISDT